MSDIAFPALRASGKTERVQLLMTADEVERINDWRFNERVETKSEAVRRLIEIGLEASKKGHEGAAP